MHFDLIFAKKKPSREFTSNKSDTTRMLRTVATFVISVFRVAFYIQSTESLTDSFRKKFHLPTSSSWGTAVAQWLRCCTTNRKVAGSIPDGVIGIFH